MVTTNIFYKLQHLVIRFVLIPIKYKGLKTQIDEFIQQEDDDESVPNFKVGDKVSLLIEQEPYY